MKKDKNKGIQKFGRKETSIVRSSAAEYLTFVAATGKSGVERSFGEMETAIREIRLIFPSRIIILGCAAKVK